MPNAADRKSIRAQEKAAAIADRQRREVIGQIMSTAPGRAWLWDTLSTCKMFDTTFYAGDPCVSAFNEGRRSVGLALLADIMVHCPDQYIEAMREANVRHLSNDASARLADDSGSTGTDPLAERSSSPVGDGGDSGTESDSGGGSGSEDAFRSPGADIYVDRPQGAAS